MITWGSRRGSPLEALVQTLVGAVEADYNCPMNTTSSAQPLGDDDLNRLDGFLDALSPDTAMLLEELDGFMAAIACTPDDIDVEELLPEILGLDDDEEPVFSSEEEAREFKELLERHLMSVAEALSAGEGFAPILMHDDDGTPQGNLWAVGFLRGITVHPEVWDQLEEAEETGALFEPFETLAEEIDFETGEVSAALAPERRQDLIEAMIEAAFGFHERLRTLPGRSDRH